MELGGHRHDVSEKTDNIIGRRQKFCQLEDRHWNQEKIHFVSEKTEKGIGRRQTLNQ